MSTHSATAIGAEVDLSLRWSTVKIRMIFKMVRLYLEAVHTVEGERHLGWLEARTVARSRDHQCGPSINGLPSRSRSDQPVRSVFS